MREVSREEIKALFSLLVQACGGIVPAGMRLGFSHQYVSNLQSLKDVEGKPAPMPTLIQVATLEAFCGQPVVTGAMAAAITGEACGNPLEKVMDIIGDGAALLDAARTADDRTQVRAALRIVKDAEDFLETKARTGT